jgi:hypothetical protein
MYNILIYCCQGQRVWAMPCCERFKSFVYYTRLSTRSLVCVERRKKKESLLTVQESAEKGVLESFESSLLYHF